MALRHVLPLLALAALSTSTPEIVIATVLEGFPWSDPFQGADTPAGFLATCTATRTFRATQHVVRDLKEPPPMGLEPWSKAIPYFFGGRPYPGSWEGVDHKGEGREIVKMEWRDLPPAARDWVRAKQDSAEDERYLFAVYEREGEGGEKVKGIKKLGEAGEGEGEDLVVLFAAAALYHIMPLLVADGSECEAELLDLENYVGTPEDKKVVAWPVERTDPDWNNGEVDIEFTIKAQVLSETEEGRAERVKREEAAAARAEEARLREEEEARLREEEEVAAGEEDRQGEEKVADSSDGSAEEGFGSGEAAESTVSVGGNMARTGDEEQQQKEKDEL